MMMKKTNKFIVLPASLFFLSMNGINTAFAGEYSATAGLGVAYSAEYEGSNDGELHVVPIASVGWEMDKIKPKNEKAIEVGLLSAELSLFDGLDVGLIRLYRPEGMYRVNAGVVYSGGRDEDDNKALRGLGDVDGHVLGQIAFTFAQEGVGWNAGAVVSQDVSDETNATTLDLALGYTFGLSETVSLSTQAMAGFADDDYMQTYFGINQQQATRSGYSRYDTEGGLKSVGLEVGLNWGITENIGFGVSANYTKLTGDAADSVLVKTKGDENQFSGFMGITYSF
jgi:outer membrane scaffolding protein for murein synthesis (MipA/OmpV family)